MAGKYVAIIVTGLALSGCEQNPAPQVVDTLISSDHVYTGDGSAARPLDIAICGDTICAISAKGKQQYQAARHINQPELVVSPGFIDPHTHSLSELLSEDANANINYLSQGVTTVVNGNDGAGSVNIAKLKQQLLANGIGTNTALLVGHGSLREQVIGLAQRHATPQEIVSMERLTNQAMLDGAIGLSTGLYYVPGIYADTQEVVALAKVAASYQGIYDTHLRDESTFNIGFTQAISEAIEIAKQANIHLHLAHIKALGVDVWGQSRAAIDLVEQAQAQGVSISADQYPWRASGTNIHSAVVPKWVMADSSEVFHQRLNDKALLPKIRREITENIRRRGGADALLITVAPDTSLQGKTLAQLAKERSVSATDVVLALVKGPRIRVASFNMSAQDIENFMVKPWVVTSSDGTDGHPRKYASFPKKYREYVQQKKLLTEAQFIARSSSQTASILGLNDRGQLKVGYKADITIFDRNNYRDRASFMKWNKLSTGVEYVLVNGKVAIDAGHHTDTLAGQVVN